MKNQDPIELLKKVQAVDAPNFLLTRINAKLNVVVEDKLNWKWAVSGMCAIAIIISINVSYLTSSSSSETNLADSFGISYSNQLYNE